MQVVTAADKLTFLKALPYPTWCLRNVQVSKNQTNVDFSPELKLDF